MCVVATYEIMHVVVYFGVCKCHGCSSHLCDWMFNLVNHACNIYVIVLYAIPLHNTHVLLAAIVCVIIGLHTHFWLQTCLPRITHILLRWTVSVLMSQRKQFIRVNHMPYIAHTLIWLIVSFVLPNHKQFIRVNRMLYIAHTFIWLPVSFVPPHRKQLIKLNHMPCIAHESKIWTVFDASSIANVFTFFDGFIHHRLRLLHRTQFLEGYLNVVLR